jgi:hypothetical protein
MYDARLVAKVGRYRKMLHRKRYSAQLIDVFPTFATSPYDAG